MIVYKRISHKNGFTLLEIVVSLGVLSILGLVLSQSFISSIRTSSKGEVTQEVIQNGNYALELMSRLLFNAISVASECSTAGVSSSEVVVKNSDGQDTTLGCVTDSDVLRIASSSASGVEYYTSDSVTLRGTGCEDALEFVCKVVGNGNKNIKITFTLAQKNSEAAVFEQSAIPFDTSITMRN